jgi:hypothetical protein
VDWTLNNPFALFLLAFIPFGIWLMAINPKRGGALSHSISVNDGPVFRDGQSFPRFLMFLALVFSGAGISFWSLRLQDRLRWKEAEFI